jgi:hypothetical protein
LRISPLDAAIKGAMSFSFQEKCQKSSTSVDESLSQFWPQNLLDIIKSIVKLESPCPVKPLFVFNLDSKAAEKIFDPKKA